MNEKPVWKNWFEESLYIQRIQVYNLKKFHAFQAQKKKETQRAQQVQQEQQVEKGTFHLKFKCNHTKMCSETKHFEYFISWIPPSEATTGRFCVK